MSVYRMLCCIYTRHILTLILLIISDFDWISNDFCKTINNMIWCYMCASRSIAYCTLCCWCCLSDIARVSMLISNVCTIIFACLFLYKPLFLCFFFLQLQLQLLLQITPSQNTQTHTNKQTRTPTTRRHCLFVCLVGFWYFLLIFVLFC
jgi:hypothetical protein